MRIINSGARIVATVNAKLKMAQKRSISVTAFFKECTSFIPQYLEVSTEAPIPIPMQQIIKILINWPASDEAES
jgi:hypothetical protein